MSRHYKPAEDGGASAASIMQDPFEHYYSEDIALEAYRKLSRKRGVMLPENMRIVVTEGKILKHEHKYWNRVPLKNTGDKNA
ncbi:MAG: hypothetical protein WCJ60_02235 [bacterium]